MKAYNKYRVIEFSGGGYDPIRELEVAVFESLNDAKADVRERRAGLYGSYNYEPVTWNIRRNATYTG